MKTLAKKINNRGLFKIEIIVGSIMMALAAICLPLSIIMIDVELLLNPYVLGVVAIGILMFAAFAFFCFIYPYISYLKVPAVQLEADDTYLYINTKKKQAVIPLASINAANVSVELPFLFQRDFAREIIIHLFSEEYGTIILEIQGYGSFKLQFVSYAQSSADTITRFLSDVIDVNVIL